MARSLDLDELVEHWTLLDDEQELIAGKRGPTRLGFALLLKFYTRLGRFPRGRGELPDDAVEFVARQVGVEPVRLSGRRDSGLRVPQLDPVVGRLSTHRTAGVIAGVPVVEGYRVKRGVKQVRYLIHAVMVTGIAVSVNTAIVNLGLFVEVCVESCLPYPAKSRSNA